MEVLFLAYTTGPGLNFCQRIIFAELAMPPLQSQRLIADQVWISGFETARFARLNWYASAAGFRNYGRFSSFGYSCTFVVPFSRHFPP